MLSNASGFSILAITFAWCLRAEICFFNSIISCAERTNESAIQSAPLSSANCKSFSSFSVKEGKEIEVLGKFTPFLEERIPPCIILHKISVFPSVAITSSIIFPSSNKIFSPDLTSCGSFT